MRRLNLILFTALTVALTIPDSAVLAGSESTSAVATSADVLQLLHVGDLVRVRSGGPLMTVAAITGDQVNCSWTDWLGGPRSESFPMSVLQGPIVPPVWPDENIR